MISQLSNHMLEFGIIINKDDFGNNVAFTSHISRSTLCLLK